MLSAFKSERLQEEKTCGLCGDFCYFLFLFVGFFFFFGFEFVFIRTVSCYSRLGL